MPLTSREKPAGRLFRAVWQASLDALNEKNPPDVFALPLWRVVRHECPAAGGASTGITLREHCDLSPVYRVCYCGVLGPAGPDFPHASCQGSKVVAADGRFAFIWKEGKCSGAECGLAVRTRSGRFVVTADRLPDHGRTNGGPASPYS